MHVYEQSLPSVELLIGDEFHRGPETTGPLGTAWRLPFGFGALIAGWLADRFGTMRLLVIYLAGCAATSVIAWWSPTLSILFVTMFAMGCFASIYHPAGLALIAQQTAPHQRGAALGWHGILGSVGIAGAPFLAGFMFSFKDVSWRDYYLLLAIPGGLLALAIFAFLRRPARTQTATFRETSEADAPYDPDRWGAFAILVVSGMLSGFAYAAITQFLPRYLDTAGLRPTDISPESWRNYLTGGVLLCGALGQAIAGKLARPGRLEPLLVLILLGNAPCLAWMAVAQGPQRIAATSLLATIHFMNQPVYNSLIAEYVPRARQSFGYGLSNMMTFGIGALGPAFAGYLRYLAGPERGELITYGTLAALAVVSALVASILIFRAPPRRLTP